MLTNELAVTIAGETNVGMVREKNEDSFLALTIKPRDRGPLGVRATLVVADGMGGHLGGEKASSAAIRLVAEALQPSNNRAFEKYIDNTEGAVEAIVKAADKKVRAIGGGSPKPPGTTFTGVFIVGNRAYIGHVGDSRAYQIRRDEIIQITEDHSYMGKLLKEGKLRPEETKTFAQKNILLKSLGAGETTEIDPAGVVNLVDGDVLLLCSDGLWDLISGDEILGILHAERNLDRACKRMIRLANIRGGHDNITVVAAQFGKFRRIPAVAAAVKGVERIGVPARPPIMQRPWIRAALKASFIVLSVVFIFTLYAVYRGFTGSDKGVVPGFGPALTPQLSFTSQGILTEHEKSLTDNSQADEVVNPQEEDVYAEPSPDHNKNKGNSMENDGTVTPKPDSNGSDKDQVQGKQPINSDPQKRDETAEPEAPKNEDDQNPPQQPVPQDPEVPSEGGGTGLEQI